tara:strand:+ start:731 stop:1417 length:687 start_codon:yes stop_codon:yes gene_type:complete
MIRIAKYIAHSGFCSRREAEKLILDGKVSLNEIICIKPNINVSDNDVIKIDNKLIKINKEIKIWKIYKPAKVICTNKDIHKRKTVFDLLPNNFSRVISIGRLDYMSEGLLLLTNNGDYARKLELPLSNYLRVYKVCIKGKINQIMINKINKGITINKIKYKKVNVKIDIKLKNYTWLIFSLKEGKNREIRNIANYFSWKIIRLIRIQFGKIKLDKLKPGEFDIIKKLI